jgi:hypothetical protein
VKCPPQIAVKDDDVIATKSPQGEQQRQEKRIEPGPPRGKKAFTSEDLDMVPLASKQVCPRERRAIDGGAIVSRRMHGEENSKRH